MIRQCSRRVLEEMLQTEEAYVADLRLIEVYIYSVCVCCIEIYVHLHWFKNCQYETKHE